MAEGGGDRARLSRRAAITRAALALGAAAVAVVRRAEAQEKLAQADAKYQPTPNGNDHCALCANFVAPHACKFVQGTVSPNGWCQLFSGKS